MKRHQPSVKLIVLLFFVVIFSIVLYLTSQRLIWLQLSQQSINNEIHPALSVSETTDSNFTTLANHWCWDNFSPQSLKPIVNNSITFNTEYIFHTLQTIEVESTGNIVPNHNALLALDQALGYNDIQLETLSLPKVQTLIKIGLPGNTGKQAAELFGSYYNYLIAKKKIDKQYKTLQTFRDHQNHFKKLQRLRNVYFGHDVADKLFRKNNIIQQYTLDRLELEFNPNLSLPEKKHHQTQMTKQHIKQTLTVTNWKHRYYSFMLEKQRILDSNLTTVQKRQKLRKTMLQHFNDQELDRVKYMQLDKL